MRTPAIHSELFSGLRLMTLREGMDARAMAELSITLATEGPTRYTSEHRALICDNEHPTVTLSPDHQQMSSIQKNVFLHFWDKGIELSSKYYLSPDDGSLYLFSGPL